MTGTYHFVDIEKKDLPAIAGLLERVFSVHFSIEYLSWKYFANPLGPTATTVIYCDDTVVGFFGILAARFVVDGKDVLAGQGVDIAIDEPHRRLDLFIRLLKEIESRSRAKGIQFNYGTANVDIDELNEVLNFQTSVGCVPRLVRIMNFGTVFSQSKQSLPKKLLAGSIAVLTAFSRKKTATLPSGERLLAVTRFDQRYDRLWERMAPDKPVSAIRGHEYLNWRIIDAPIKSTRVLCVETDAGDEVKGFIALQELSDKGFRRGTILDFAVPFSENPIVFRALLEAALNWFAVKKVGIVDCWMFENDRWYGEIRRYGFMSRRTDKARFHFSAIQKGSPWIENTLSQEKNWQLSISDSDQFGIASG
jgi:GNAT superfamily N-acetyltransferase